MSRLSFLFLSASLGWAASALPAPASGIYFGIWSDPNLAGSPEKSIELREGPAPSGVDHPFALHLIYQDWAEIAQQLDSRGVLQPNAALAGDIAHGRIPVISWKCDLTVPDSDHVIANGNAAEDAVITATALALKQYPGPVMLRWFWEFNQLNKNQSCRGDTGGTPTAQVYGGFINAWRHIWTLFQSAGATNVVFVWNPGSYTAGKSDDPAGYYPGNNYVDWIAIDTYQNSSLEAFHDDFGQFYSDYTQTQYGLKPLMVGENGSANVATKNEELQSIYLQGVIADMQSNRYPLLKAYDYFDAGGVDTRGATVNWTLDSGGLPVIATMAASPLFNVPPVVSSVANGATYLSGGLVAGSWALVKGSRLSNVSRTWAASDFAGLGNNLPVYLSGVQVMVDGTPAAVYYIDPGQISFQVPSGISGTAAVQVITGGAGSSKMNALAPSSAPGIFPNVINGVNYPAAVFLDGKLVGDPSVNPVYRNAKAGDTVVLFATGLMPEPGGVVPTVQSFSGVKVTMGTVTVPADYAGQTGFVGEFQINFTVPNLRPGSYPVTIQIGGVSSPLMINTEPTGPIVIPVR